MSLYIIFRTGAAAAVLGAAMAFVPTPSVAQDHTVPGMLAQASPQPTNPQPGDAFGEDATLTAKPMLYIRGTGKWDTAFDTISKSLKKLEAYLDKEGLKAADLPVTIFTAIDDNGFDFEAAIRLAEPPKNPPRGDIALGQSPDGRALKFVYRGAYGAPLEYAYEAILNYVDEKRVDTKDVIVEEYVTDPASSDEQKLVINIFVMVK